MRNSTPAQDDAEDTPADELIGNTVKGAVPDLDPGKWADESKDGDPPGPKKKPAKKSAGKARKALIK